MSSPVEKLMREFMAIDKDRSGHIDKKELVAFYTKKGHSKQEVDKWMEKFDADNDGKITFVEFARALGCNVDELKDLQKDILEEESGKVASVDKTITVIASTLTSQRQKDVTDHFKTLVDQKLDLNQIGTKMREYMENKYHPTWQVVALEGSYAMHFVHEPFNSIQAKYNDKILLAWRTPRG